MKSPRQLADRLLRQWQQADWRDQHLLHNPAAWPLRLPIGEPGAHSVRDEAGALRLHLQQWRAIAESGPGQVDWALRQYRSAAAPVQVPTHWVLQPSDCAKAFERYAGADGVHAAADYRALAAVLGQVDSRFHPLLLRRLSLWRGLLPQQLVTATRVALQLEPGCAVGRPLRAMSVAGNDSKFYERHASLLTALLDTHFDGEASRQGLAAFLGAVQEGEHWLLVAPLTQGLLPFSRQRVIASELQTTALPASRILLVENERCLHQLTTPVPDTIAILGAGLNLGWLSAPWLQGRQVAYWGDMDTWGLAMLATTRSHLPQLQALLMDAACFASHQHLAVTEPVHADATASGVFLPGEAALERYLRTLPAGRLEQEFLPVAAVRGALEEWLRGCGGL